MYRANVVTTIITFRGMLENVWARLPWTELGGGCIMMPQPPRISAWNRVSTNLFFMEKTRFSASGAVLRYTTPLRYSEHIVLSTPNGRIALAHNAQEIRIRKWRRDRPNVKPALTDTEKFVLGLLNLEWRDTISNAVSAFKRDKQYMGCLIDFPREPQHVYYR